MARAAEKEAETASSQKKVERPLSPTRQYLNTREQELLAERAAIHKKMAPVLVELSDIRKHLALASKPPAKPARKQAEPKTPGQRARRRQY